MPFLGLIFLLTFLFFPGTSFGYQVFLISLPDNYGALKKEKIFYVGAAEPAFGLILDLKTPKNLYILLPNGTTEKPTFLKTEFFDRSLNTKRVGYKFKFSPSNEGDHLLCLESDYTLLRDKTVGKFLVKTPFHVVKETYQKNLCNFDLEIKPYTRPYGFKKHGVFWGQVWYQNKPLSSGEIEVEYFSPVFLREEDLPKDSYGQINYPYLKNKVRLSKNGFFVVSFEHPGWWVITVKVRSGEKTYGNQKYPLYLIHHLWIYVFSDKKEQNTYEYFEPYSK